jgi:thiol-disulfide isomerase/thioredoxin
VVDLGLASFDSSVQDGSPWLVMVYAPWCAHCKALEPTWRQLASALEGEVKVGRVDGSAETLLGKRLGVRAYPSIFFMHEGVFVEYGQGDSRDLARLTKFARGGWKDATPAPWWKAPNSAFGRATAGLWHLPGALQGTYEGLTESGWSDHSLVAAAIMAAVASGLVAIALLDCCVAGGFKLHLE